MPRVEALSLLLLACFMTQLMKRSRTNSVLTASAEACYVPNPKVLLISFSATMLALDDCSLSI